MTTEEKSKSWQMKTSPTHNNQIMKQVYLYGSVDPLQLLSSVKPDRSEAERSGLTQFAS